MPPPPLEQLFLAFVERGDERALEQCMRRCGPPLRRLARRLGASADDADDLVQETIVAAIQDAGRFDAERPLLPWLRGILTFRAAHLARATMRRRRHYEASANAPVTTQHTDHAVAAELDDDVRAAIDDLPERYREPLVQYLLAQRSPREIAEAIGEQRSTVRVRLHRGLQRLRDALRRWAHVLLLALFGRRAAAAVALLAVAAAALTVATRDGSTDGDAGMVTERGDARSVSLPAPSPPPPTFPELAQPKRAAVAEQPHSAALHVEVRDRDGAPLAGVGVTVEPASGRDPVLLRRAAVTDARGVASWTGLRRGRVLVAIDRGEQRELELTGDQQRCAFAVDGGLDVRGVVVDASGRPVPGAAIWLSAQTDGPWRGQDVARSDDAGGFRLAHVPDGAFVAARHERHARSAPLPCAATAAAPRPLQLVLGPPGAQLSVTTVDEHGAPVAGATVFVGDAMDAKPLFLAQGAAPWRAPPFRRTTDADGRAQTLALRAGAHPVFVHAPGRAPQRAIADVRPGAVAELRVVLPRGAALAATVVDERGAAVPHAMVSFRHADPAASIDLFADRDGALQLDCLPTGAGQVVVAAMGFTTRAHDVWLAAGSTQREVICLQRCRRRTGLVTVGGIAPPAGSHLRASWPPSALRENELVAPIAADGRFEVLDEFDATPRWSIHLAGEPLWRPIDAHAVAARDDTLRFELPHDFAATSWIEGTLRADDGRPLRRARLFVRRGERQWSEIGRSDEHGAYRLGPLPADDYLLFAETTDATLPTVVSEPFALAPHTTRALDLTSAATGELSVTLRRDDGRPVDDAVMTLAAVDVERRYAVRHVPAMRQRLVAGRYVLSVMGSSFRWVDALEVEVRAGSSTPVDVELRAAHNCSLALLGGPPRAPDAATTLRLVDERDGSTAARFTLLADAPPRLGAVLCPGDYAIEHDAPGGDRWRGTFTVTSQRDTLAPLFVPMQRLPR